MEGGLLALFLYYILKHFGGAQAGWFTCHGCDGLVRFDGTQFVHRNGRAVAVDQPTQTVDPLDTSSELMTHRASPVDYPLGRVA